MRHTSAPISLAAVGAFGILGVMNFEAQHIVTIVGGILALVGTWLTARATLRARQAEVRQAEEKARTEAKQAEEVQRHLERQAFVDQLQEERDASSKKVELFSEKIDTMWRDKAASREHVAALRRQIWDGGNPPPVDPPAGYIE